MIEVTGDGWRVQYGAPVATDMGYEARVAIRNTDHHILSEIQGEGLTPCEALDALDKRLIDLIFAGEAATAIRKVVLSDYVKAYDQEEE